jgi:hypothetical protein
MASLNPVAQNDPAVHAILSASDAAYQGAVAFQHQQTQLQSRSAASAERYYQERILPHLTAEDASQFIDEWQQNQQQNPGTTGLPPARMLYWGQKATQNRTDTSQDNKKELLDLHATHAKELAGYKSQLATMADHAKNGMKAMVNGDQEAFPLHTPGILARHEGATEAQVKQADGPNLDNAKKWDADPYGHEEQAAAKVPTRDAYVALGGDKLSDAAKERRGQLWDFVHTPAPGATPAPVTDADVPSGNPPSAPVAPAAPTDLVAEVAGLRKQGLSEDAIRQTIRSKYPALTPAPK